VTEFQRQYFDELQIQFQPGVGTTGLSAALQQVNLQSPYIITDTGTLTIGPLEIVNLGEFNTINFLTPTTNPQAMLRWSNDGGSTWSNEHWTGVGQTGKYRNRAIWRRLGTARDRIFEVVVTDPVNFVIISANLKVQGADN
jgi:hypothetical protein